MDRTFTTTTTTLAVSGRPLFTGLGARAAGLIGLLAPLLAGLAQAQAVVVATPPSPVASPQTFWNLFLGNLFAVSLILIFLGAIIGAILNARRRDRVLRDFNNYHVTAVFQDGRRVWGVLAIFPNGIEMRYRQAYRNALGNIHNSFVLYQNEYPAVRAILRLENELTPENRERRLTELIHYYNPTIGRQFWRWSRKQFALLRDAFMKSFALLVGQAKKVAQTSSMAGSILTTQDKQITEIGTTVLSSVNLMNDPILERYIGRWCVAEVKEGDGWREISGILKEYSTEWIELLEAAWPRELAVVLPEGENNIEVDEANCLVRREGNGFAVDNHPPEALELIDYLALGETRALGQRQIPPGETVVFDLGTKDKPMVTLRLRCMEPADVILPRAISLVRHAGRREHISWLQAIGLRRKTLKARRAERLARRKLEDS